MFKAGLRSVDEGGWADQLAKTFVSKFPIKVTYIVTPSVVKQKNLYCKSPP